MSAIAWTSASWTHYLSVEPLCGHSGIELVKGMWNYSRECHLIEYPATAWRQIWYTSSADSSIPADHSNVKDSPIRFTYVRVDASRIAETSVAL